MPASADGVYELLQKETLHYCGPEAQPLIWPLYLAVQVYGHHNLFHSESWSAHSAPHISACYFCIWTLATDVLCFSPRPTQRQALSLHM